MAEFSAIDELLKRHDAVLIRNKRHEVWRLPTGATFVRASTPSDHRAAANQLARLKRALNLVDEQRGQEGERRNRKSKGQRSEKPAFGNAPAFNSVLADQLRLSGALENELRAELDDARRAVEVLEGENALLHAEIADLVAEISAHTETQAVLNAHCLALSLAPQLTLWARVQRAASRWLSALSAKQEAI